MVRAQRPGPGRGLEARQGGGAPPGPPPSASFAHGTLTLRGASAASTFSCILVGGTALNFGVEIWSLPGIRELGVAEIWSLQTTRFTDC